MVSTILTTIDVTIGKKKVVFPFLITMSPGNLPIKDHSTPINRKQTPRTMNSLEMPILIQVPSNQNDDKPGALPFYLEAFVVRTLFGEGTAHTHLQLYGFLHLL